MLVALVLTACGKASDEYATYADAAMAGVFEQAWLPPVVPTSATLIRVVRHLDGGEAQGWFHFPSQDFAALEGQLRPYSRPLEPDPAITTYIAKKQTRGYAPYEVNAGEVHWLFVCSGAGGKCYFKRWSSRRD